jgi:hypothetical protein
LSMFTAGEELPRPRRARRGPPRNEAAQACWPSAKVSSWLPVVWYLG